MKPTVTWYFCDYKGCKYTTKFKGNLDKHKKTHQDKSDKVFIRYKCSECSTQCRQKVYFTRHTKSMHDNAEMKCLLICLEAETGKEVGEALEIDLKNLTSQVESDFKTKCLKIVEELSPSQSKSGKYKN